MLTDKDDKHDMTETGLKTRFSPLYNSTIIIAYPVVHWQSILSLSFVHMSFLIRSHPRAATFSPFHRRRLWTVLKARAAVNYPQRRLLCSSCDRWPPLLGRLAAGMIVTEAWNTQNGTNADTVTAPIYPIHHSTCLITRRGASPPVGVVSAPFLLVGWSLSLALVLGCPALVTRRPSSENLRYLLKILSLPIPFRANPQVSLLDLMASMIARPHGVYDCKPQHRRTGLILHWIF